MTIAMLATGDEIIYGDTLNTNSQKIAHYLSSEGLPVGLHLACSDYESDIFDCISFLVSRHDILIITGGLGPTSDDRTRFALGRFLNEPLIEFSDALQHIEARLQRANIKNISTGNKQQALFPATATLLPNPNGTAMGAYCSWQNKLFVLLPGPPNECLPMFNNFVLPLLQQTALSEVHLLKWRLFGVPESVIAQQIDEALADIDCETGYRLETPYVECKVRCKPSLINTVKNIVEPIVGPHIIATPAQKASDCLSETITSLQLPMSLIDEATGGVLQTLIQKPANYHVLKFYQQDTAAFRFRLSGLEEFWSQEQGKMTTKVIIDYDNGKIQGQEAHELPYRSALVPYFAAEWLSFRLIHLINKLHKGIA